MKIALAGGDPNFIDSDEEEAMRLAAENNDAAHDKARDIVAEALKKKQAEKAKNG